MIKINDKFCIDAEAVNELRAIHNDFEISNVLDDLICATVGALNFYDENGDKQAVEICEQIKKLVDKLETYEKDIYTKLQPEYWADLKNKEVQERG